MEQLLFLAEDMPKAVVKLEVPSKEKNIALRELLKMNLLVSLDETQKGVAHRAARLYTFNKDSYQKLKDKVAELSKN